MTKKMESEISSVARKQVLGFLIHSAHQLQVPPIVKYTALSLFAGRFLSSSFQRFNKCNGKGKWLLQPMRDSNLQLFSLISIWISSKIASHPMSVKSLKSVGDKMIKEQHYTTHDFLDAEVIFMQVLNFEIGASNIAFVHLEELYNQFKSVAKIGDLVSFEACMDIIDLLYENEETCALFKSPCFLAASIMAASYLITVPKQKLEFPILSWVKFVTSCKEEDIVLGVRGILKHVLNASNLGRQG